jgi:cation:H+ antiporter
MFNLFVLLIGFTMLIKGSDIFVEASSNIAKKFHIPSIIIGMTIVAMGTSAPELSVSINSALAGLNDMSIANVVGSNVFNILIALGVCSFLGKLKIDNHKDIWLLLAICIELFVLTIDKTLSIIDGAILLITFTSYIISMIKKVKSNTKEENNNKQKNILITIVLGILGLIAIVWGGDLVVNSASAIAIKLGMSENLVGLTIVAVGTSLPEFVTSVMATKKGELSIAIGNIIGSNIFNILLILGIASAINPMTVSMLALCDIIFMICSVALFILLTVKNKTVNRKNGFILVLVYIVYLIITIIR